MGKVIFDMSMSLDGFVRASGATAQEPLGRGGEVLHEWAMGEDRAGRELLATAVSLAGAYVCGRRTYDDSVDYWGPDGPTGFARLPLFVLTDRPVRNVPDGGVYSFVTDGIESALEQARQAAAGKNIAIMGGPNTGRQFIRAGLVDQIGVHVAPVLFGDGLPLFDHITDARLELEIESVVDTRSATHLLYRTVK